jgi:putative transposase
MDFVSDALTGGKRSKALTNVDDFTKESINIALDHGISGHYVTRVLDQAVRFRGAPRAIRTDHGPEITERALDQWVYSNGVQLKLIQTGKPTQKAYVECFNRRFRDERLNEHWFTSLAEARILVAAWSRDYNERRPHRALDYQTPAEFGACCRNAIPGSIETENR